MVLFVSKLTLSLCRIRVVLFVSTKFASGFVCISRCTNKSYKIINKFIQKIPMVMVTSNDEYIANVNASYAITIAIYIVPVILFPSFHAIHILHHVVVKINSALDRPNFVKFGQFL